MADIFGQSARRQRRWGREVHRFQTSEREAAQAWQEQMSSTAYQRAMADMRSAGLNPMLAYQQGGAQVGGVGMGSGAGMIGGSEDPVSAMAAVREHRQNLRNLRATESLLGEQKRKEEALADREEAQNMAYKWYRDSQGNLVMSNEMLGLGEQFRTELELMRGNLRNLGAQATAHEAQAQLAGTHSALNVARLPREESISRIFSSPLATPLAAALMGTAFLTPARGLIHFRRGAGASSAATTARVRDAQRKSLNERVRRNIARLREERRRLRR